LHDHKSSMRVVYGGGLRYFFSTNFSFRGELVHIASANESRNNFSFNAGIMFHPQFEDKNTAPFKTKLKKKVNEPLIAKNKETFKSNEIQPVEDKPTKPISEMKSKQRIPATDKDNDGVFDTEDKCPNTIQHVKVDRKGCPYDSDNDNVYDYVDKCPGTLKYEIVDSSGCPKDNDNDGVKNSLDKCPDTEINDIVDKTGCPSDSDGDGVKDSIDICPGTYASDFIDLEGCEFSKIDIYKGADDKGFYPYTIQISSYNEQETSNKIALKFQAKGDPTFTSVAYIDSAKEKWYRIFFGFYGKKEDIATSIIELKNRKFRHFLVRKLPYAIQIGTYHTERNTQKMENYLQTKGYIVFWTA
ncbi:OmpA/MotB domain protein, partial [Candidatus Magnetomorum sp. HK-1]